MGEFWFLNYIHYLRSEKNMDMVNPISSIQSECILRFLIFQGLPGEYMLVHLKTSTGIINSYGIFLPWFYLCGIQLACSFRGSMEWLLNFSLLLKFFFSGLIKSASFMICNNKRPYLFSVIFDSVISKV